MGQGCGGGMVGLEDTCHYAEEMVPMYSKWPPKLPSDTPFTKWLGAGVGWGYGGV